MNRKLPCSHLLCLLLCGWALVLLAGCSPQAQPTIPVVKTSPASEKPATHPPPLPTLAPTGPAPTAEPTPAAVEQRLIELEWPARLLLGDSDLVRLALIPYEEGYVVEAEFPEHQIQSQQIPVPRPGGYSLSTIARLDGVGFELSPTGDQTRELPPGEPVTWRWALAAREPGQQRLSITLVLRWTPTTAGGILRESLVYTRGLDVQVVSVLGLSRRQALTTGLVGVLLGGGLGLAAFWLHKTDPPLLQQRRPNAALVLEPDPAMHLSPAEGDLLRVIFGSYARVLLVREFLSGYSGARAFLALPVRPEGRADAYTIVKMSDQRAIEAEFENYQRFVKDTLPPITARIQHPPVAAAGRRVAGPQGLAALRYTFIGEPGSTPASLRQALLAHPDPALLWKLFETFGPNWWMQRNPYSFRLALEYDRKLPPHLTLEPCEGRGVPLDGDAPPPERRFEVGEVVALRGFGHGEPRPGGGSLTLAGAAVPGFPAVRVRWLSPHVPRRPVGRVVSTRESRLAGLVCEFTGDLARLGLPDPLGALPRLLGETVRGTQAIIHGDLNLENVLVGPGGFVWLIDFARTREGHPLFDFAHLHAEIIAHVLAPQGENPQDFVTRLENRAYPLLATLDEIASRCMFDPAKPREYHLALAVTCLGALKYENLAPAARKLLFLAAGALVKSL